MKRESSKMVLYEVTSGIKKAHESSKKGLLGRLPIAKIVISIVVSGVVIWIFTRPKPLENTFGLPPAGADEVTVGDTGAEDRDLPPETFDPDSRADKVKTPVKKAVQPRKRPTVRPADLMPAAPKDHVIVIATCLETGELGPLRDHFAKNGFATELRQTGDYYLLVTKDKYKSPKKDGSKLDATNKRIRQIGEKYKPPTGYKGFSFNSTYGMKLR